MSNNARRLDAAGYRYDSTMGTWLHPRTARAIDAAIAERLTADMLTAWLAAGRTPPRDSTPAVRRPNWATRLARP
jgi:hypothetical protein